MCASIDRSKAAFDVRGGFVVALLTSDGNERVRLNTSSLDRILKSMEDVARDTQAERRDVLDYLTASGDAREADVEQLGDVDPFVREAATERLSRGGRAAYTLLRAAKTEDAEARLRIDALIAKLRPMQEIAERIENDVEFLKRLAKRERYAAWAKRRLDELRK